MPPMPQMVQGRRPAEVKAGQYREVGAPFLKAILRSRIRLWRTNLCLQTAFLPTYAFSLLYLHTVTHNSKCDQTLKAGGGLGP